MLDTHKNQMKETKDKMKKIENALNVKEGELLRLNASVSDLLDECTQAGREEGAAEQAEKEQAQHHQLQNELRDAKSKAEEAEKAATLAQYAVQDTEARAFQLLTENAKEHTKQMSELQKQYGEQHPPACMRSRAYAVWSVMMGCLLALL